MALLVQPVWVDFSFQFYSVIIVVTTSYYYQKAADCDEIMISVGVKKTTNGGSSTILSKITQK